MLQNLLRKAACTKLKVSTHGVVWSHFSTVVTAFTQGERKIAEKISSKLNVSKIEVEDISGGCGSMYRIFVASADFAGKRTIQQHRIINEILKDDVEDMHGLTIETSV